VNTEYLSRVLQMLCQPLQGSYSTGGVTLQAQSATTTLTPGDILVPVIDGCDAEESALKVEPNPATDGSWNILTTGTQVAVTSLQGGAHCNLPIGTQVRFDDTPTGLLDTGIVTTALTGGVSLDEFGCLRQVRCFKDLGSQVDAKALFAAQLGRFPAAVLQWGSTSPGDGSTVPTLGGSSIRVGKGKRIYCHEWSLMIVSSRFESSDRRKREGDRIRDRLLELLTDRSVWRGVKLSAPEGIMVQEARLASINPTAYVDSIRFSTWFILQRSDGRVFNDWITTNLQAARPSTTESGVTSNQTIVDIDIAMPGHGD